ncbi:MAG: HNH endonuclease [Bacteroidales bacterium]|nr:HNH endonuclease [Candidatus Colicola equi]
MPTIFRPKKKISECKKHGRNKAIHDLYNTRLWREIRAAKLMEQPLCERCLQKNTISPAVEVHHIVPISTAGDDDLARKDLAYDYANLQSLCEACHHELHNRMRADGRAPQGAPTFPRP